MHVAVGVEACYIVVEDKVRSLHAVATSEACYIPYARR